MAGEIYKRVFNTDKAILIAKLLKAKKDAHFKHYSIRNKVALDNA